jgi:inosine/xanthosine triphosphatase
MKIFVGSANPVKVNAVLAAAIETWPDVEAQGFSVESGVSDQPFSDEETKQGAINRAKAALEEGLKINKEEIVYLGVGMEGGIVDLDKEMWSTVWAAVVDQQGSVTLSAGARFRVPDSVADKIRAKVEMGHAVAEIIGEENKNKIKQEQGLIGILTNGFIDRTEEYQGIIKLALGIWYGKSKAKELFG